MTKWKHMTLATLVALLAAPAVGWAQTAEQSRALQALDEEPSCQEVQQAALKYFNISGDQFRALNTRAKAKAFMPVVEVSGGFTDAQINERTDNYLEQYYPWLTKAAAGDSWDVRGKLVWDMPKKVFNPEVLDVASLAGLMQGVLKESTRLYYMRRRLQVDLILSPPADRATHLSKQMRLDELTALIDAMTGSWFSQQLRERSGAGG